MDLVSYTILINILLLTSQRSVMYLHTYEYKNKITILIKYYVSVLAQLVEWCSFHVCFYITHVLISDKNQSVANKNSD